MEGTEPVYSALDVEPLSVIKVKNPRKSHVCHRCENVIDGEHLKLSFVQHGCLHSIRECRTCTAELRDIFDERTGTRGSLIVREEC